MSQEGEEMKSKGTKSKSTVCTPVKTIKSRQIPIEELRAAAEASMPPDPTAVK